MRKINIPEILEIVSQFDFFLFPYRGNFEHTFTPLY
jgi:hypothetical protein